MLLIGFGIKIPLVPLPGYQTPTLSFPTSGDSPGWRTGKLGTYGLVRFGLGLFLKLGRL